MPRRTNRETSKPLALGFFGVGDITTDDLKAQLDDLAGKDREVIVYLGIAPETEVDTFADVIDWAADAKATVVAYAVADGLSRNAKGWLDAVDEVKEGGDVVHQVVERLADRKAVDGKLLVFWDQEAADSKEADDGRAFDACEAAADMEVASYNICNAMDPIDFRGGDDEPPANAPEPEPEPAPPARSRRSRAAAQDEEPAATPARRRGSRSSSKADEAPAEKSDVQDDAREAAFDKLKDARRESDPSGGQGSIAPRAGDVDFAKAVVYFADLVADKVIAKLQAAASSEDEQPAEKPARSRRSR